MREWESEIFRGAVENPAPQVDVPSVAVGAYEVTARVGMGDADQCLGALPKGQAEQVDGSVLGCDPVHVPARGHDSSAGLDRRNDAADGAARPPSMAGR